MYKSNGQEVLNLAREYFEAGLNPIPLRLDGSKCPRMKWKRFTTERIDWDEVSPLFNERGGIGIICGAPSGGLEVIDFDTLEPFADWCWAVADLLGRLPVVATPDSGRHIYFRCDIVLGNQVLAADESGATLIETRGQGGLVVAPGSPLAVHPTGKPYSLLEGSLMAVPTITQDERSMLLKAARAFNRYQKPIAERPAVNYKAVMDDLYGVDIAAMLNRPGDQYNQSATWEQVLEPHGWQFAYSDASVSYWTRPGKGYGISASTGYCNDCLYVFSSNAHPLEAGQTYSKFAAFATLNFAGDFSEAARTLSQTSIDQEKGAS